MERTLTNNNILTLTNNSHADSASCNFVTELLTMTLADQNTEVIIEPQDFRYNRDTGIKTTESIRGVVDRKDIIETRDRIEVTLSGKIENQLGHKIACTLYFCLWMDKKSHFLSKNICTKTGGVNSIIIELKNCSEDLLDSVFELDLYKKDSSGMRCFLGNGRGYLIFDHRA